MKPAGPAIFSGVCDFVAGAATPEQVPEETLPEIAFAGRSNVGKSSLINALTGRRSLARTSQSPGRTQQLNFFSIGGTFMLVDMPGYGYAQVSRSKKSDWQELIRLYLRGRSTLRCVFVLVDSRHGLKDSDHEMLSLLGEAAVSVRVVLTKADKSSVDDDFLDQIRDGLKRHPSVFPEPMLTSAVEKRGLEAVQDVILTVVQ